jgi:hypothetical protein
LALSASAETIEFQPEADTHINERYEGINCGKASSLAVGGSPHRREMFLRFETADLPAGVTVTDASLVLIASNGSKVVADD